MLFKTFICIIALLQSKLYIEGYSLNRVLRSLQHNLSMTVGVKCRLQTLKLRMLQPFPSLSANRKQVNRVDSQANRSANFHDNSLDNPTCTCI